MLCYSGAMADDVSLETKIAEINGKLDSLLESNKKLRAYLLWSILVPLGLLVLPLLALPLMMPLLQNYLNTLSIPAGF